MRRALNLMAVVVLMPGAIVAAEPSRKVDFNREVRPILATHCLACHGPDDQKRKAGLLLDQREAAIKPASSGETPIVPGKPDESDLIERISSEDPHAVMPPPATHKTLKPEEKATLRAWIEQGAEYQIHWAFRRPIAPGTPAVHRGEWARNEIDAFVLAELERLDWTPSPEADRATLLRRVSLDLTGLLPTIAEREAFLGDKSPDAYEKVVDRLLASPQYGERWARRWLDRARYSDTNGYQVDRPRSIWPYRDWVIDALNADMPFDRFTIEQVAGDMLPNATPAQKVATGFHRNTMVNEEGGIDVEEFRYASIVDRVATTGAVWLGLTVQCAQCHTHKFDPITQREYYQLFAFLNNADEPIYDIRNREIEAKQAEIAARLAVLEADLPNRFPAVDDAKSWEVLNQAVATVSSGNRLRSQAEGSIFLGKDAPETETITVVADTKLAEIREVRLEALTHPGLPHSGPGRAPNGNFVLTDFRATASPVEGEGKPVPVEFASVSADVSQAGYDVSKALDADPKSGWAIDDRSGKMNVNRTAIFRLKEPIGFPGGTRLTITLAQDHGGKNTLGRIRLSARSKPPKPLETDALARFRGKLAEWEQAVHPARWSMLTPSRVASLKNATMTVQPDRSVLVSGDKPNNDTYEVDCELPEDATTGLRLETLPDPSLPDGGPGRAVFFSIGDFNLTGVDVLVDGRPVDIAEVTQDFAEANHPASRTIDGQTDTGWSVKGGIGQPHAAVFRFKEPIRRGEGGPAKLRLVLHMDGIHQMTIGRFRVSATSDPGPKATRVPAEVESALLIPMAERNPAQSLSIERYFASVAPELAGPREEITALKKSLPRFPTSLVMEERDPTHLRPTQIHNRGEFLSPTEPVSPGVPAVLPPIPEGVSRDRLALARWLVSTDNPLVGRVVMNQAWEAFFGRGLVATVEDFGTRGDEPSHPELLDWLATEFPRRGWSQKRMHRLIVTSATYRQASKVPAEHLERDPKNIKLARGPRFRVDAEMVRDIALGASGLLNLQVGGPSVFPPQPEGLTNLAYSQGGWTTSTGPARHRRGLYTHIKRTAPYAAFSTFDAPSAESACVRRERSTTPLQALTLLNDAVFVEASQALARRLLGPGTSNTEDRIRQAYLLVLSRPPREEEVRRLSEFHDRQADRFRKSEADPIKINGPAPADSAGFDPIELACWTTMARVLLNLDETITKE